MLAFEERSIVYEPTDIARAGVFVSIDSEGRPSVDRVYVRPEHEAPVVDLEVGHGGDVPSSEGQESGVFTAQQTVISVAGSAAETEEDEEDVTRPLPDRLITELTAHRTLALRDALAESPAVAFQAVLHNFVLTTFYRFASFGSCLQIGFHTPTFPAQAPGLKESPSAKAIDTRHEGWKARLPESEADLWDALTAFDGTTQAALFAHCASFAVNALYEPANRYNQAASPPTVFARVLTRPMYWRVPLNSTWSKPGGVQRWTTISAVSPSPAFLRRFGTQRASLRLN